jgi:predicted RNA-binding Zn ribbon-like protein
MPIDTSSPPFAFLGGDPSLDLVNTVAWTRHGLAHERLTTYDALTQWAEGAGVITSSVGASLRRRAKFRSHEAAETLTRAWEIRAILQRVFAPEATAKDRESSLTAYNALLHEALQRLEIGHGDRQGSKVALAEMRWSWRERGDSLDSPLWPVVWSAAMLLVSQEASRIRKCGGQDCGWVYVDRSRNGLRRWCRMETCGTQAKSRRRRERTS